MNLTQEEIKTPPTDESNLDNPLVSIIVITYNSSKYVLETLESAKAQTYQNIELIVSDDCSTDNTVEICRNWIEENKERFVRTELITTPQNNGIPANCNKGVKAAQGEWVKLIAGDDALMDDCIKANIGHLKTNKSISILQTNVKNFQNTFADNDFIDETTFVNSSFFSDSITNNEQYSLILYGNRLHAPAIILKREVIEKCDGFDERIPLIEDLPFWTKALKLGFKIYYLNVATVKYRKHNNSVITRGGILISKQYSKNLLLYSRLYKRGQTNIAHYCAYNLALLINIFYQIIQLNGKYSILDELVKKLTTKMMCFNKK